MSVAMMDGEVYECKMYGSATLLDLQVKLDRNRFIPLVKSDDEAALRYQFLPMGCEGDFALPHDATISSLLEAFQESESDTHHMNLTAYVVVGLDPSLECMASQQRLAEEVHLRSEVSIDCGTCGKRVGTSSKHQMEMNLCKRCYQNLLY